MRGAGNYDGIPRLTELADHVEMTVGSVRERCLAIAPVIAAAPALTFLGSGPNLGTAMFSAAKMIEAAGITSVAPDLGEWWHVERRARPPDAPVFVIAPPGRSHERAALVAAAARRLGRQVIAVVDSRDAAVSRCAQTVLSVEGRVREEFSPLTYHVFAGYLASFVAQRLGRTVLDANLAGLPGTLDDFARPDAGGMSP